MRLLTRDEILNASDMVTEVVPTPEWGEDTGIMVRRLTAKERDKYESEYMDVKENSVKVPEQFRAPLVVMAAITDDFKPLFTMQDLEKLALKSGAPIHRAFVVIARLSGMKKEALEESKKGSPAPDSLPIT